MNVPIISYHKIGTTAYTRYWTPIGSLTAQMTMLMKLKYTPVGFDFLLHPNLSVVNPIVITFDDALGSFKEFAYPILRNAGIRKVTCFVPTHWVGEMNDWDGDSKGACRHMTWEEIEELHREGVDFQSHGHTHTHMSKMTEDERNAELELSGLLLEEHLQKKIEFFAYPYGDVNDLIAAQVKKAGYKLGLTTGETVENTSTIDFYRVKRITM